MSKKLLIFVILSLLAINAYTLIGFYRLKIGNSMRQNISKNDELNTYKVNFSTNIQNSHIKMAEVVVKDSSNNVFPLKDILDNGRERMLVCRFSELHCESCVESSIQLFRQWTDSVGKDNTLFLGTYRNNRIFNRTKPVYGINDLNTYNILELNIPVEKYGSPYYFVLNNNLTISDVFVPSKSTPYITNNYLQMIYKRYFMDK